MFSKLIATAVLASAPAAVLGVPCNLGSKNPDGKYAIAIPEDLYTADECVAVKAQLMRCIWLYEANPDFATKTWATEGGWTGLTTGFEWLADEPCPVTGTSLGGGACMTWADADANATHPVGLSGKVPLSHVLVSVCENNQAIIDKYLGAFKKAGTSGAWEDGNKASKTYVKDDAVFDTGLHVYNFMFGAAMYCSDNTFGTDPIWSCKMMGQSDSATPLDFGATSMDCCNCLHTMVALDAHAGKNGMGKHLSMVNNDCPAHGAEYGGCVGHPAGSGVGGDYGADYSAGILNKPTEIAEVNALDAIRTNDCTCGDHVMANAPDSAFKKLLNADGDDVLDLCTTSTTAAPTAASDDSGASGLVASFSALALAMAASFM